MPSGEAGAPCPGEGNPPSSSTVFRGRSATSSQGRRALELMKRGSLERSPRALLGGLHPPVTQGQSQDPEEAGTCPGPSRSPSAAPYLDALVEEGVPDLEQDVADEAVRKDHKEPVEGDEGQVHVALSQVGRQPGQLLQEEVLEHPLVHLQPRGGLSAATRLLPLCPSLPAGPHTALGPPAGAALSVGTACPEELVPSLTGRHVTPQASSLPGWSSDAEVSVDQKF